MGLKDFMNSIEDKMNKKEDIDAIEAARKEVEKTVAARKLGMAGGDGAKDLIENFKEAAKPGLQTLIKKATEVAGKIDDSVTTAKTGAKVILATSDIKSKAQDITSKIKNGIKNFKKGL